MRASTFLLGTALFLAGCAGNPYEKFYKATPGATPEAVAQWRVTPAPDAPELIHGGNPKSDIPAQLADGYAVIGVSSFHGTDRRHATAMLLNKRSLSEPIASSRTASMRGRCRRKSRSRFRRRRLR